MVSLWEYVWANGLKIIYKIGKWKRVNDHHMCIILGIEQFSCGPKMDNYKSGDPKRMSWLAKYFLFHTTWDHFWVPWTQLFCVHLYTKYDVVMFKLGRLYIANREFDLLASLKKCNKLVTWNTTPRKKEQKSKRNIPHHLLYSVHEKQCTCSKPPIMAYSTYFPRFWRPFT